MDIRNVGNHGSVDRSGDRGRRPEPKQADSAPLAAKDDARISSAGREKAAQLDALAQQARKDVGDRDAVVEAARQKLINGDLDGEAAIGDTAKRLLDRNFLTA